MTLPSSIILPDTYENFVSDDPSIRIQYMRDLINKLKTMYEDLADNINGNIRSNLVDTEKPYIPNIIDSANTTITFTYTHQTGWSTRIGLTVEVWFDILWTAASAPLTGFLNLQLPYKVAKTSNIPFVGIIQSSNITYTVGDNIVINAENNTFNGQIWNYASGIPTSRQNSVSSGRIIGNIRYLTQFDS